MRKQVPHFHHEVVYQASVMAIESMHARIQDKLTTLLKALQDNAMVSAVTTDSVKTGRTRALYVFTAHH